MKIKTTSNINAETSAELLYAAISNIKTVEEAQRFFEDLCTPAEIQAIADRWLVVDAIMQGKPYRQIHDETGVSITTVGRVARSILLGTGGYKLIYQRLKEKNLYEKIHKAKNRDTKKRQTE